MSTPQHVSEANFWEEGYVVSSGVDIRYVRARSTTNNDNDVPGASDEQRAKPPLVLVHGFTDSARYFTRLAEALCNQWDVFAYDARGHGATSRAVDHFDDATRVADLLTVVEHLQLDHPVLLGHSMGAATIAQAVAGATGQPPLLARAIVLEDPGWFEPSPEQEHATAAGRAKLLSDWRDWVQVIQSQSREAAISSRAEQEPNWDPIDIATSVDARRAFQLDLFDYFPPTRSPWRELVPKLRCPTLLMIGGNVERGRIITPEVAQEAQKLNPLLQWVALDGAGHHLRFDSFEEFVEVSTRFLAKQR